MIDPLDEPESSGKIAELCEMLLNQAREDREKQTSRPSIGLPTGTRIQVWRRGSR